ncbi:MAG: hypothetical protein ACRDH5_04985 [bacterium]
MADYRYMARRLLKDNRPNELKQMRQTGNLEAYLDEIQEDFGAREVEAVHRTMKGLLAEMAYQERVQAAETAKREIQEFLIDELRGLLGPEESEVDPDETPSEKLERERLERVRLTLGY